MLDDNTWEYKWQTANLNIDAGTYTVYAVATPHDKINLADTQYATVSVIIRKPFVTAQASQSTVAQGDKLFIPRCRRRRALTWCSNLDHGQELRRLRHAERQL